jgi:DNA-binding Xre family transcriptional regulator
MKKGCPLKYKKIADPLVESQKLAIGLELKNHFNCKGISKNDLKRLSNLPITDQIFNDILKGKNYTIAKLIKICIALDLQIKIVKKCH